MPAIQLLAPGPDSLSAPSVQQLPHVLFVVDGFPRALGGGERIVLRLAELLPRYGYRASILTFARHPESSFRLESAPCPVYLLPLTKTYGTDALRGALSLRRFLRRERVEVVQTFFESSDIWAGTVTRLLSPARLVWSRRDMGILRGPKHALAYRLLRRLPHAVSAVSQRVAQHVIDQDRVPSSRVHVVYNGIDLEPWDESTLPPSTSVTITTVGNIRHVKGHDVLVAAAAEVIKVFPAACFSIAGEVLEPAYYAQLLKRVQELGLSNNVRFIGKISDLASHFRTADIFVLPSRSEGFSNALIEAMASGLPSVATDVGGNSEAIQHGSNGLIVAPENVRELADALMTLLRDAGYRQHLGAKARYSAETRFSADAMMRSTTAIFKGLNRT